MYNIFYKREKEDTGYRHQLPGDTDYKLIESLRFRVGLGDTDDVGGDVSICATQELVAPPGGQFPIPLVCKVYYLIVFIKVDNDNGIDNLRQT